MGGEAKPERLKDLGIQGAGRCPFCRDLITDAKEVVACAACGARHHEACRNEHGACASCSATDVLVPRTKTTVAVREKPPRGSVITVRELDDGGVRYAWPSTNTQAIVLWSVLLACTLFGAALIPFIIWQGYRRKRVESFLTLRDDALELELSGLFTTKSERAPRADVGAVRLTRHQQIQVLSVDVGVDRINVGGQAGFSSLKPPEQEWLYEILQRWKEQG